MIAECSRGYEQNCGDQMRPQTIAQHRCKRRMIVAYEVSNREKRLVRDMEPAVFTGETNMISGHRSVRGRVRGRRYPVRQREGEWRCRSEVDGDTVRAQVLGGVDHLASTGIVVRSPVPSALRPATLIMPLSLINSTVPRIPFVIGYLSGSMNETCP